MRRFVWLLALAGCAESSVAPVEVRDLARAWRGTFTGEDACGSGDVTLALQPDGEGLSGTFRYETDDAWAGRVHALYQVAAVVVDGVLVVDQLDLYEADALPDHERWCRGRLELTRDPGRGTLEGSWVPSDCACAGSVELTAAP